MERLNEYQRLDYLPSSEEETVALAEKVLGIIPEWYRENKETIEKNRVEQNEWDGKITQEISLLLERLGSIRQ